jgi:hypothetical protein
MVGAEEWWGEVVPRRDLDTLVGKQTLRSELILRAYTESVRSLRPEGG